VPAAALALVVYAVVLLAVERLLFADDLAVFVRVLPSRVSAWSASRSRNDRRSA
jgi:hypothetical protein